MFLRYGLVVLLMGLTAAAAFGQAKKPISKVGLVKAVKDVKCAGANGLTTAELTELLNAQNQARAAQKLAPFTWDCRLAGMAQAWAARGVFEHRDDSSIGENMFVASMANEPVGSAVTRWMSEQVNWTNKSGTCAAGKICTHYTQLMWKKTTKVGCGINRNGTVKWTVVLVCDYDPPGNMGSGPAY